MERVSFGTECPLPAIAKKARLSVRNWRQYNESLVARGSITIWFSEETLQHWYNENRVGKRGRSFTYSDSTMELFLTIRELWRSPYRRTEGFVRGILALLADDLHVPDFTSAANARLNWRLCCRSCRGVGRSMWSSTARD